jgi:hypothetical protein
LLVGDQLLGLVEVVVGKVVISNQLLGEIGGGVESGAKINETLADGFERAGDGVAG